MSIILIILSILLVIVVLIQNSKGGGLDSNFGAQSTAFGAQRTTEVIEKITWGLASAIALVCIIYAVNTGSGDKGGAVQNSEKKEGVNALPGNPSGQQ